MNIREHIKYYQKENQTTNKMTALEYLKEYQQKNNEAKFITKDDDGYVSIWRAYPIYSDGSYRLSSRDYDSYLYGTWDKELEWNSKTIFSIEDVREEFFTKWYIRCTKENREVLNGWRMQKCEDEYKRDVYFHVGNYLVSKCKEDESYFVRENSSNTILSTNYSEYKEITFDQFKKYVLKENSHTSSIEITPKQTWIKNRINEYDMVIKNHIEQGLIIPFELINERNELFSQL